MKIIVDIDRHIFSPRCEKVIAEISDIKNSLLQGHYCLDASPSYVCDKKYLMRNNNEIKQSTDVKA